MSDATAFRGVLTALVTPFRDGALDIHALDRLVSRQIDAGVHGLVPCGTTGEAATLSPQEHVTVVRRVVEIANGRVPVLAGAGSNDTKKAIELARACEEAGADGTLQVTPYYNRPPQAGLIAHFRAIADACRRPVILYNVPSRTGCDMHAPTVAALSGHPRIVGIKEATGDMGRASEIHAACAAPFTLLSGDDFSILPFLALGGHGVISVVSNVMPGLIVRLCEASPQHEDAVAAHEAQLRWTRALFAAPNPIPTKAALAMLGLCTPEVRSPLLPLASDDPLSLRLEQLAKEINHDQ